MSDSELGRLNVSLGMLDAGSLLAAQALHGAFQAALCHRRAGIGPHLPSLLTVICRSAALPGTSSLRAVAVLTVWGTPTE